MILFCDVARKMGLSRGQVGGIVGAYEVSYGRYPTIDQMISNPEPDRLYRCGSVRLQLVKDVIRFFATMPEDEKEELRLLAPPPFVYPDNCIRSCRPEERRWKQCLHYPIAFMPI